jgi:hypothetical protein
MMSVSRVNKKNPIAKILRDRRYRQLVLKDKKKYDRKKVSKDLTTLDDRRNT